MNFELRFCGGPSLTKAWVVPGPPRSKALVANLISVLFLLAGAHGASRRLARPFVTKGLIMSITSLEYNTATSDRQPFELGQCAPAAGWPDRHHAGAPAHPACRRAGRPRGVEGRQQESTAGPETDAPPTVEGGHGGWWNSDLAGGRVSA